jgi:hypothetical protein
MLPKILLKRIARLSQELNLIYSILFLEIGMAALYSFLLKDYADCQLTNQSITYDENIKAYKVYKTYFDGHFEYIRHLAFLNRDRLAIRPSPQIIDYENAIIYMEENHKENIIIDGEFYVKARFWSDDFKYSFGKDGSIIIENLEIIEIC